jgi:hypothetical protein
MRELLNCRAKDRERVLWLRRIRHFPSPRCGHQIFGPKTDRLSQCLAPRQGDHPLCTECGWIFDVEDDDDDDDDDDTITGGGEVEAPWTS